MEEQQSPERLRQRREPGPGVPGALFDAMPLGVVQVTHGIYRVDMPIRELSVGEVRGRAADELDIDPEAVAMLDGHQVGDDATVRAGQKLTFVRRAGEKGRAA